jgi:hypothetical protein
MPCDIWKNLTAEAKRHRLERSYFASNDIVGVSKTRRKKLTNEHAAKFVQASRAADVHRQWCPICKNDPPENFHDPDPWDLRD